MALLPLMSGNPLQGSKFIFITNGGKIKMGKEIMELVGNLPVWAWVTVGCSVTLLFELLMMFKYRRLAGEARKRPEIEPIHFRGAITEDFAQSARKSLLYQLDDIIKIFRKMREEFGFRDAPVEIGKEFSTMMALASASLNLDPSEHPTDYKVIVDLLEKIRFKTKWIEASLGTLVKVIVWLFKLIPVPYRKSYIREVIHVSYVPIGNEILITVYRKNQKNAASMGREGTSSKLTYSGIKNEKESDIFRDIAFMILELHGKAFPELKWRGMRYFTDGLNQLDLYRSEPKQEFYQKAKEAFHNAVKEDPIQYEACCFLGSMLVSERKEESINKAIKYFEQALRTDRPKFKAFTHAGLAHCYAQQYHRLAQRKPEVLVKARKQAKLAADAWNIKEAEPNPWIQYTRAMTMIIDEGTDLTPEEMKRQFIPAMNLCLEAIQVDEKNGLFHNTLGWMLLKLVEKEVPELTIKDGISENLEGNVAELAEQYFLDSIRLSEKNKLSHANLCLLYASPYFRKKPETNFIKSRSYGEKAIQIDPNYINGYRDLTVSLIRYGKFDDAYKYYLKALEKAAEPDKDLEIISDVRLVLVQMGASEDVQKRFRNPPSELLRPPAPTHTT
jgi:tetratricopeptide (TPR) repeat protein